jgi:hypothetical protein
MNDSRKVPVVSDLEGFERAGYRLDDPVLDVQGELSAVLATPGRVAP